MPPPSLLPVSTCFSLWLLPPLTLHCLPRCTTHLTLSSFFTPSSNASWSCHALSLALSLSLPFPTSAFTLLPFPSQSPLLSCSFHLSTPFSRLSRSPFHLLIAYHSSLPTARCFLSFLFYFPISLHHFHFSYLLFTSVSSLFSSLLFLLTFILLCFFSFYCSSSLLSIIFPPYFLWYHCRGWAEGTKGCSCYVLSLLFFRAVLVLLT